MSNVFISYANEDRSKAEKLAHALEARGWSVWWDRHILPGKDFDHAIEEALSAAKCVIVLWSPHSVTSHWVKDEATQARERSILLPALIAQTRIPIGFRQVQTADLSEWPGDSSSANFEQLLAGVAAMISSPSVLRTRGESASLTLTRAAVSSAMRCLRWLLSSRSSRDSCLAWLHQRRQMRGLRWALPHH
jgi:hypothetical protein